MITYVNNTSNNDIHILNLNTLLSRSNYTDIYLIIYFGLTLMIFIPKEYIRLVHLLKNCRFNDTGESDKVKIYQHENGLFIIEGKTTFLCKNNRFLTIDKNLFTTINKPIGVLGKTTFVYCSSKRIPLANTDYHVASPRFEIDVYQVKIKEDLKGVIVDCPNELVMFLNESIIPHFKEYRQGFGTNEMCTILEILISNNIIV